MSVSQILFAAAFFVVVFSEGCFDDREAAKKSNEYPKIVPKCTKDGRYQDFQCYQASPNCTCVRDDGTQILKPSTKVKTCACISHYERVNRKRMVGNYKPQCEEDGTYKRTQCRGSTGYCWCVNRSGTKTFKSIDNC